MLSWICPECGRECLPTERECSSCSPVTAASGLCSLWDQLYSNTPLLLPAPAVPAGPVLLLAAPPAVALESVRAPEPPVPSGPCSLVVRVPAAPSAPLAIRELQPLPLPAPNPPARKSSVSAWLVGALAAMLIVLGLTGLRQRSTAVTNAAAAETKEMELPVARAAGKPSPLEIQAAAPDDPPYPLARLVEVTGLRIVVDLNHRSQVQYLVVNHSATPLADIGLTVTVRSAMAAAASDQLFTVSARVPLLGPHESKEIRTDLDSQLRSVALPDWDNLRTDVKVTLQR